MSTDFARGREPIFNLPTVVAVSVGLMVLIHVVRMALPDDWDELILGLFAFAPDRYFAETDSGPNWPGGAAAAAWSPFTYALLHNDLLHLVSNCAVFTALGNVIARRMSAHKFILFCLVMAPLAALGELALVAFQSAPVIGVSGVICAMLGAFARFGFPKRVAWEPDGHLTDAGNQWTREQDERPVSARRSTSLPPSPNLSPLIETLVRPRVLQFIAGFAVLNFVLVFAAPVLVGGGAGVAWMVHVAGFIAGFLLYPFFERPIQG